MSKISIIGAGSWGTALANILCENNHAVLVYDNDLKTVSDINNLHKIEKLPGVIIDNSIKATSSIKELLDYSDIIIISVPTKVIRDVLSKIKDEINSPKIFVNTSKGIEPDSFKRISEIVKEVIPKKYFTGFVALTGPSHAEEVVLKLPTTIVSVSECQDHAKLIQNIFSNHINFRVYTGSDLLGSELCGALKNVYAIASGMLEGLGFGDNARAGLITRALVELRRIVIKLGAKPETLFGLTGVGDLIVTTTSHHSRNFQAGVKLAKGSSLEDTINSMSMVVEGVRTCLAAYSIIKKYDIDAPIITAVYRVLYDKIPVAKSLSELFSREFKEE